MTFFRTLALLCCLTGFLAPAATAQTTGGYDTSISFAGQQRAVSLFVPPYYSPPASFKLVIGLHGLGDTCSNYRNAIVSMPGLPTLMDSTIFVCPEAQSRYADYYVPAGGEAIIEECIRVVRALYNIDTTQIFLQGFSLGGRAALRYGLDHYDRFKGLMLNTPAVQGVKNSLNGISGYTFNYFNASKVPIFITHGTQDITYTGPIDTCYRQLLLNNGKVRLHRFNGGHTIPLYTAEMVSFFDKPERPGFDADLYSVEVPARSCNTLANASCIIRNTGTDTIHSIQLQYTHNGTAQNYNWTGTLPSFRHAVISLPALNGNTAAQSLKVKVQSLNGSVTDTVVANNEITVSYAYAAQGLSLPQNEGFESTAFPPANWMTREAGEFYSAFERDDAAGKGSASSAFACNTILFFDNRDRREELISPVLNLSTLANPYVKFDVAANYHRYTPPYLTPATDFGDTLEVSISTDCGEHFTSVYKKGGADLATFSNPLLNVLTATGIYQSPADNNWRSEKIDLSSFGSATHAVVKFSYISGLGGFINLDNISFSNKVLGVQETVPQHEVRLFPNPASGMLTIQAEKSGIREISVSDMSGRQVMSMTPAAHSEELKADVSSLPTGVYLVRISTGAEVVTRKVTIAR